MKRLVFSALLALCCLAAASISEAQQPAKTYRIGFLSGGARPPEPALQNSPLWRALRELGYVEGTNLAVERRFAEGKSNRLPGMAAELVALKPDVIFAISDPAAQAVKAATGTIPVVMIVGDPVGTGLVASLARPGGNLTGVTVVSTELSSKRLDLLKEAVPSVARAAVLWNATDRAMTLRFEQIEFAAKALGVAIQPLGVREPEDFDAAFSAIERDRPDALLMITDALTTLNRKRVIEFAARNRLPTVFEYREPVDDGGLMSYGPTFADLFALAAKYIDKVLKGAKPSELPMEQPTRYYLVVNLKAAKALGLAIPHAILLRADEVIE